MRAILLYLSAPLLVALLAPLAVERTIAPYPAILLIGTVPVVLLFTCLVAVPLYLAIPRRSRIQPIPMVSVAFLAGVISFILFSVASPGVSYSQVGEVELVAGGHYTAAGWYELLLQSLCMGAASLPGGLLFCQAAKAERALENAA